MFFKIQRLVYSEDIYGLIKYAKLNTKETILYLLKNKKYDLLYSLLDYGIKDDENMILYHFLDNDDLKRIYKFGKYYKNLNEEMFIKILTKYQNIEIVETFYKYLHNYVDKEKFPILYSQILNNATDVLINLIYANDLEKINLLLSEKILNADVKKLSKYLIFQDIKIILLFFNKNLFYPYYLFLKYEIDNCYYNIDKYFENKKNIESNIEYFIKNNLLDKTNCTFINLAIENQSFFIVKLLFDNNFSYTPTDIKIKYLYIDTLQFYLDKNYTISKETLINSILNSKDLTVFKFLLKKCKKISLPFYFSEQEQIINFVNIKILIDLIDIGIVDLNNLKYVNKYKYIEYLEQKLIR